MKKRHYLTLLLCANVVLPAAYNPDEIMPDVSTLGKRSRTEQNKQDERKKRETGKIIHIQSSVESDSHELLPIEMETAQNQSQTLNELIAFDQEQGIDPTAKVYQFSFFDTQALKDIINIMTVAEQRPEEIDNEIKNILSKQVAPYYWHKGQIYFAALKMSKRDIKRNPNIFILLNATDFFQASDTIKNALIKYLFTQVHIPEDHNEIIAFLNKFLAPNIIRNYMPYIAKQYFLTYQEMPEEWKNIYFELSIRELPEHFIKFQPGSISEIGLDEKEVTTLNLSRLFLTSLDGLPDPPDISQELAINLSHNRLRSIPKNIMSLNPVELDISYNALTQLPDFLASENLEDLYATHNNISTIPANLNNINWLDLAHNKISSFDNIIGNELNSLALSNNLITTLPSFGQEAFPDIWHIDLSNNPIEHIPEELDFGIRPESLELHLKGTALDSTQIDHIRTAIEQSGGELITEQ
ncbi:MAG: hypothetical protein WD055_00770 [Candidatus Dependentiae bacterium]